MFGNSQMMGMDIGFPDVCNTPTPAGPVPIPYPNIALGPMGVPAAYTVLFMATPAHNLATTVVMTNGDNAGVAMGVASSRLTSVALQNSTNCPGVRVVPSQVKVLVLAP